MPSFGKIGSVIMKSYYEIELKLNANQLQTTPFNEHKSAKSPLDCSARFRLQQCVMKLQYIKFCVHFGFLQIGLGKQSNLCSRTYAR